MSDAKSQFSPLTPTLAVSYNGETLTLDPSKPEEFLHNYERVNELLQRMLADGPALFVSKSGRAS